MADWYVIVVDTTKPNDTGQTIKSGLEHEAAVDLATQYNTRFFQQDITNKRANVLMANIVTTPEPAEGLL